MYIKLYLITDDVWAGTDGWLQQTKRNHLPNPKLGLSRWLSGKESTCNAGDVGSILGLGRFPEEEKATHSSILAQAIPWAEEAGRLRGCPELDATQQLNSNPKFECHVWTLPPKAGQPRETTGHPCGSGPLKLMAGNRRQQSSCRIPGACSPNSWPDFIIQVVLLLGAF